MKYVNGHDISVGDLVIWGDRDEGRVVCSVETGEYSAEFPQAEWSYLGKGIMVIFPRLGLVHFTETDLELQLVGRAK